METLEDTVRRCIRYNPLSGELIWKEKSSPLSTVEVGSTISPSPNKGRYYVRINKNKIQLCAIAWFLHSGAWPDGFVEHIDQDFSNNKIENLRVITRSENKKNIKERKNPVSKFHGVHYNKRTNMWLALHRDEPMTLIGSFECEREAALAYNIMALEISEELAKLNDVFKDEEIK